MLFCYLGHHIHRYIATFALPSSFLIFWEVVGAVFVAYLRCAGNGIDFFGKCSPKNPYSVFEFEEKD